MLRIFIGHPLIMIAKKPGAPGYILCADDDIDDQSFITDSFHAVAPYQKLVIVANGYEIMAFLKGLSLKELPSQIILDQYMPQLDGRETLQLLKADPLYSNIPIVFLSSWKRMFDAAIMHTYNAVYAAKPYTIAAWERIAKKILNRFNKKPDRQ